MIRLARRGFVIGALAAAIAGLAAGQPWIARHGLTGAAYQSEFTQYTAEGYRPTVISGYASGNQMLYAAIFEKTPNAPAWIARHGLTPSQYQAEFNTQTAQGYRPVRISGYAIGTDVRYAVIFEKSPAAPAWTARQGMSAAEYQSEFDKYTRQGYRLAHVCGYGVGQHAQFAAIWEKSANMAAWTARHGMTPVEYQGHIDGGQHQAALITEQPQAPVTRRVIANLDEHMLRDCILGELP